MNRLRLIILLFTTTLLIGADGCISIRRNSSRADGGVFRSDTAGTTWAQVNYGGKTARGADILYNGKTVRALVFDPLNSSALYWGTNVDGILRTINGGGEWKQTGIRSGAYPVIEPDPETVDILYAATGGVIVKSIDGGTNWTKLYTETRPAKVIVDVVVDFFSTNTVLAVTNDGVLLRSIDFGQTWALHAELKTTVQRFVVNPKDSRTLYALIKGRAPLVSRDGGSTWQDLSESLAKLQGAAAINDFVIFPEDPSRMLAATNRGLLVSSDGGTTWEDLPTLIPLNTVPIQHVVVHPKNPNVIFFIARNLLHVTVNGGLEWTVENLPTSKPITALLINPDNPDQLFLGTAQPAK